MNALRSLIPLKPWFVGVGGLVLLGSWVIREELIWRHSLRVASAGGPTNLGVRQHLLPSTLTSLFGSSPDSTTAEVLEQTSDLTLLGTLAVEGSPRAGFAILSADNAGRLVAVGGRIGSAELVAVYPDHVVLSRDGRLVALPLPRTAHSGGSFGATDPDTVPVYSGPPIVDPNADEVRTRISRATAPLSALLKAEPLLSDEVYRGLVVHPNGNSYLFGSGGLQSGDVLTSVNGIGLTQDRLNVLADEMRSGRPVKVSLLRPGVGTLEVVLRPSASFVGP